MDPRRAVRRRRSTLASVLGGAVVMASGVAIGVVEAYHLPKGSIWGVVGVAVALVLAIRALARPR